MDAKNLHYILIESVFVFDKKNVTFLWKQLNTFQ